MKIHVPYLFVKPNYNNIWYRVNVRALAWFFQVFKDEGKRGFWIQLNFNEIHWKIFLQWITSYNTNWKLCKNYKDGCQKRKIWF